MVLTMSIRCCESGVRKRARKQIVSTSVLTYTCVYVLYASSRLYPIKRTFIIQEMEPCRRFPRVIRPAALFVISFFNVFVTRRCLAVTSRGDRMPENAT